VFNVLLQILDDGRLTDGHGRNVDFRNTVIIMTSNIGSQFIVDAGAVTGTDWAQVEERVRHELRNHFRPEFLNRVDDIIVFHQLTREHVARIVDLQLAKLEQTLAGRHLSIELTPAARELVANRGYDPVYGARPLKREIQRLLQNPIALELLEGRYEEGDTIVVDIDGDGLSFTRRPTMAEEGVRA
jgi:ATP-dependent Clp protease ATP-binding subunit ClpB